ncbi:MAG: type IV pilus assembly protein PilM [Planctomycetota bacterium]|jgi:type IV pilus assembly protein PilM
MFSPGKSIVGLDVGSSSVKAVELSRVGKGIEVTGFGQVELSSDSREEQISAISTLIKQGGFNPKRIVSSVSGKMVIIRYLSMVPMSEEELRNAIIFEAEKYIPFGLDEGTLDCQKLEGSSQSSGNDDVILVAVKKSVIEDHVEILQKAGCTPEIIDVDAIALGNAYELMRSCGEESDEEASDDVMAFVDIGATKTCLNIVQNGSSMFTREIYFGGKDFTTAIASSMGIEEADAEAIKRSGQDENDGIRDVVFPTIDDLGNEIQLSFDFFENQHGRSPDKIQLSGGGSRLSCLRDSFERMFERPTVVFNPFEGLPISDDIDQDLLSRGGPSMVIAMGLASRIHKG